jgi:hypothetical protein
VSGRAADLDSQEFEIAAPRSARPRIIGLTMVVLVVAVGLSLTRESRLVAVAGSFAIGWSHLVGRCGASHLGTLTPRSKLPGGRRKWLAQVVVYVAAGTLASSAVGGALAVVGGLLVPTALRGTALMVVLALAFVAAASDVGLVSWRLPEPNRQTRQAWGYTYRRPVAAALWGIGLGLTVATVFTFSGVWLILTLPVAIGELGFGATLLVVHWLGRATPILMGPILLGNAGHTIELLDDIERSRGIFRAANLAGIALVAVSLIIMLSSNN